MSSVFEWIIHSCFTLADWLLGSPADPMLRALTVMPLSFVFIIMVLVAAIVLLLVPFAFIFERIIDPKRIDSLFYHIRRFW